jgi:hypothetical protein
MVNNKGDRLYERAEILRRHIVRQREGVSVDVQYVSSIQHGLPSITESPTAYCINLYLSRSVSALLSFVKTFLSADSGRAMAQAVSRRPFTAEARVGSRVSPCGI